MNDNSINLRPEDVPKAFEVCFNDQCPRRHDCVRRLAGDVVAKVRVCGPCVYPTALADGQCSMFRQQRIIRAAYGFRTLFEKVRHEDYSQLRSEVIFHFRSESDFWRYNRGHYKLSPEQQEEILGIFRSHGYDTSDMHFQHYVEQVDLL